MLRPKFREYEIITEKNLRPLIFIDLDRYFLYGLSHENAVEITVVRHKKGVFMDDNSEDETVTLMIKGVDPGWRHAFKRFCNARRLDPGQRISEAMKDYVEKHSTPERAENLRQEYWQSESHKWKRKPQANEEELGDQKTPGLD